MASRWRSPIITSSTELEAAQSLPWDWSARNSSRAPPLTLRMRHLLGARWTNVDLYIDRHSPDRRGLFSPLQQNKPTGGNRRSACSQEALSNFCSIVAAWHYHVGVALSLPSASTRYLVESVPVAHMRPVASSYAQPTAPSAAVPRLPPVAAGASGFTGECW